MKEFINKTCYKIIIAIITFTLLFNTIFPVYSNAKEEDASKDVAENGGSLFEPVYQLIEGVGDSIMNLLQGQMYPGSPYAVAKRDSLAQETFKGSAFEWIANMGTAVVGIPVLSQVVGTLENTLGCAADAFLNFITLGNVDLGFEWGDFEEVYKNRITPSFVYSPAAIFSNYVPAFDVNFINPTVENKFWDQQSDEEKKGTTPLSGNTASILQETISVWYSALRNIAIVGLMIVLLYIGIRILLSSTSSESAKYKEMIKDWVIAIFLVFFMHYFMTFLLGLTQIIIDMLKAGATVTTSAGGQQDVLMNTIRLASSFSSGGEKFGYVVMYAVMVIYTLIFTWQYFKRTVYMAFLTIIAPLVALTYPIDKIKDGKAQAFGMWSREYIFNLILQPVHLLLYTILVSSAIELALTNIIYALVAIGFLIPAEKIIKKMFGFQAEGGAMEGGILGGAMLATALNGMNSVRSNVKELRGGKGGSGGASGGDSKVKYARKNDPDASRPLDAFQNFGGESNATISGGPTIIAPGKQSGMKSLNASGYGMKGKNVPKLNNKKVPASMVGINTKKLSSNNLNGTGNLPSNLAKKKFKTNEPGKIRKLAAGAGGVGKGLVKRHGKTALKLAAGGFGAATLGTLGIAAGLASDNYGDVAKYAGLAAGAGATAGGAAIDVGDSFKSGAGQVVDDAQQGYYGGEYYEKVGNAKADKEWKKDDSVIEHFKQEYGKDYQARMDDALELRKQGIVDEKEIDKAIKLKAKNSDINIQQAGNIVQLARDTSRDELIDDEKRPKIEQYVQRLSGNESTQRKVMGLLDEYYKVPINNGYKQANQKEVEQKGNAQKKEPRSQETQQEAKKKSQERRRQATQRPSGNAARARKRKNGTSENDKK